MNWTTRDGREIPVEKMEDAHLCNTMRMLERQTDSKKRLDILRMIFGPHPRGEMALEAFDDEVRAMEDREVADVFPIYQAMQAEATKRRLAYDQWCVRCQQFHAVKQTTCTEVLCRGCGRTHPLPRNELHHEALRKEQRSDG